jgi:hypothetical protein
VTIILTQQKCLRSARGISPNVVRVFLECIQPPAPAASAIASPDDEHGGALGSD